MLPPLVFENKLPFVIDVSIPCAEYEMRIEPGERISVYCIKCNSGIQIIFKVRLVSIKSYSRLLEPLNLFQNCDFKNNTFHTINYFFPDSKLFGYSVEWDVPVDVQLGEEVYKNV